MAGLLDAPEDRGLLSDERQPGLLDPVVLPRRSPGELPQRLRDAAYAALVQPFVDAYRAATGKMTEDEAKDFFIQSAMALGPGGRLPLGRAARMARAIDGGFYMDMPLAHGTSKEFTALGSAKAGDMTKALPARMGTWMEGLPA